MIKNFIHFPLFLFSLAIGLLFVYLNESPKRIIYIYPTPENVDKFKYRDVADNCFKYVPKEVNCPTNPDEITEIPMQS